jgi:uncharacterized protein
VIYLDTSAFVKLLWSERETPALQAFLADRAGLPLVSSALLLVEARRAVLREAPSVRSLEAIHLATALQLGQELRALVTYDHHLASAAGRQQLPVAMPGAAPPTREG